MLTELLSGLVLGAAFGGCGIATFMRLTSLPSGLAMTGLSFALCALARRFSLSGFEALAVGAAAGAVAVYWFSDRISGSRS